MLELCYSQRIKISVIVNWFTILLIYFTILNSYIIYDVHLRSWIRSFITILIFFTIFTILFSMRYDQCFFISCNVNYIKRSLYNWVSTQVVFYDQVEYLPWAKSLERRIKLHSILEKHRCTLQAIQKLFGRKMNYASYE